MRGQASQIFFPRTATANEYLSEYSSVLGIRVGVPHLTKLDVGGAAMKTGQDFGF